MIELLQSKTRGCNSRPGRFDWGGSVYEAGEVGGTLPSAAPVWPITEGFLMIRSMLAVAAVAAGLWAFAATASAEDKKEVKLTGTLVCGKCGLKQTPKCSNVLQVKEGDKLVNYFLDDKGNGETYHEGVCGGDKVENVAVTGTVTEKDGKKWIKPTKVEAKK